eukprot:1323578-Pyramimonas_sp.AAC.2
MCVRKNLSSVFVTLRSVCSVPGEMDLSSERCYQGFGHGLAAVDTLAVEQALAVCAGWLNEGAPNAVAAEACKNGALQQFVQQHARMLMLGMVPANITAGAHQMHRAREAPHQRAIALWHSQMGTVPILSTSLQLRIRRIERLGSHAVTLATVPFAPLCLRPVLVG